jgi:hypothetical protein
LLEQGHTNTSNKRTTPVLLRGRVRVAKNLAVNCEFSGKQLSLQAIGNHDTGYCQSHSLQVRGTKAQSFYCLDLLKRQGIAHKMLILDQLFTYISNCLFFRKSNPDATASGLLYCFAGRFKKSILQTVKRYSRGNPKSKNYWSKLAN